MTRILLTYLLPIVLPTLLYVLWLRVVQRRAAAAGQPARAWAEVPWAWLFATGLALAGIISAGTLVMGESDETGDYRPPYVDERGRVVPGRFE